MTLEEKLELFYKTAIEDATKESAEMVDEYEESIKEESERMQKVLLDKAETNYRRESEKLNSDRNKLISSATKDVKKQILEEEKSFEVMLFNLVQEKLNQYMQTEEYKENIIKKMNDAAKQAEGSEVVYYINATDASIKSELEQKTGFTIEIAPVNIMGGVRCVIRDRNLLIDNSFLAKFTEEKQAYTLQ